MRHDSAGKHVSVVPFGAYSILLLPLWENTSHSFLVYLNHELMCPIHQAQKVALLLKNNINVLFCF